MSKIEKHKPQNIIDSPKSISLEQEKNNTNDKLEKVAIPLEQEKNFTIDALIRGGESSTLEFKSSMLSIMEEDPEIRKQEDIAKNMRGNEKISLENKIKEKKKLIEAELSTSIVKTIAAFLNSEGGILLVGVQDDGRICGIEKDYAVFKERQNFDGWLQHLVNLIEKQIGTEFFGYLHVDQISHAGKTIAKIIVKKSARRPAFVAKKGAEFYIRSLNTSHLLDTREASNYIHDHFE